MSNDARVTLVGNITRDPDLKFLPSGLAVAEFGMACRESKKNASGGYDEVDASFFDISVWGQMAENVVESCPKGTRVVVTGTLKQETWEKDGQKRSKVKITADNVGPDLRWVTTQVAKNEQREGEAAKPSAVDDRPRFG